jgi:hypothetical protein
MPIQKLYELSKSELDTNYLAQYDFLSDEFFIQSLPYWMIQKLHSWQFDTHNLIGRGLAVDINTL